MEEHKHTYRTTTSDNWRECTECHIVERKINNVWTIVTTVPQKKKLTEQEKTKKLHRDLQRAQQEMKNFSKRIASLQAKPSHEIPEIPLDITGKSLLAYSKQVNTHLKQLIKEYEDIKWFLTAIDSFFAIFIEKEENTHE